jgi:mannose-1-phosphate guanylyltransferase/mannose-6-phosphate isomerase
MPADHYLADEKAFRDTVLAAAPIAAAGHIVTFGITPSGPETGFGYIAPGEPIEADGARAARIGANGFREKPNRIDAERYVAEGYLWNAGIFLFSAQTMLAEIARFAPETFNAVSAACAAGIMRETGQGTVVEPETESFLEAPLELSIDVAVMERTDRAAVVPMSGTGWSDVGSLSALWEIGPKDESGNAARGDALLRECRNVFVDATAGRKVVAAHLQNMLIVDTEDALIVLPADKSQVVKAVVGDLRLHQAPELAYTREARFGWGEVHVDRTTPDHTALSLRLADAGRITRYRAASPFETWLVTNGEVAVDLGAGIEKLPRGSSVTLAEGDVMSMVASGGDARIAIINAGLMGRTLNEAFAPAVAMPGRHRLVAPLTSREVA